MQTDRWFNCTNFAQNINPSGWHFIWKSRQRRYVHFFFLSLSFFRLFVCLYNFGFCIASDKILWLSDIISFVWSIYAIYRLVDNISGCVCDFTRLLYQQQYMIGLALVDYTTVGDERFHRQLIHAPTVTSFASPLVIWGKICTTHRNVYYYSLAAIWPPSEQTQ